MELDGAELWNAAEILRGELRDIGHYADLHIRRAHRLLRGRIGQLGELVHGHAARFGRQPQRIGPTGFRCAEHRRHLIAARQKCLQRGFSEILLPNDRDAHATPSDAFLVDRQQLARGRNSGKGSRRRAWQCRSQCYDCHFSHPVTIGVSLDNSPRGSRLKEVPDAAAAPVDRFPTVGWRHALHPDRR
jgi:hypothetical protein